MGIFEKVLERHLSKDDIYHRARVCKFLASKPSINRLLDNLERPLPRNLSDVYGWRHSYLPREQRSRWNSTGGNNLSGTLSDKSSDTFSNDSGYYKHDSCGASHVTNSGTKITPGLSASHLQPLDSEAKTKLEADKHMSMVFSTDSGFSTSSYGTFSSDTDTLLNAPINSSPSKRSNRRRRVLKNKPTDASTTGTRKVSFSQHMPMYCKSGNPENAVERKSGLSKKTICMSLPFHFSDNFDETSPGMSKLAQIRQDISNYVDLRHRREKEKLKDIQQIETKYRFPAFTRATQVASRKVNTTTSESRRRVKPSNAETPKSRKAQKIFVTRGNSDSHGPLAFDAFTKTDKQFLPLEPTFPRKFADDPPEFQQFSSHVMEVILHFEPRETKHDTDEFPFNAVLEETSLHDGTGKYIQSLNAVVKAFSNEKLEIHGLLPWNDTKELLKFILVVIPETSPDGRALTYKGTYRRQMKPDAQFMTWRFRV